jgi:hypothetical protein
MTKLRLFGYSLDSGSPYPLWFALSSACEVLDHLPAGHRFGDHGLLNEAVEQLAPALRSSPVKAERELVQLVVQVFPAYRALVSSQQPSL